MMVKTFINEILNLKDGEEMKTLVATIGVGKGTWGHIGRLMQEDWDKIILISNEWSKEKFTHEKHIEWIIINPRTGIESIAQEIEKKLEELGEIHINIISGSGKEHMALLIALKNKNLDYKLCVLTKDGVKAV